jgi:predicted chitinase
MPPKSMCTQVYGLRRSTVAQAKRYIAQGADEGGCLARVVESFASDIVQRLHQHFFSRVEGEDGEADKFQTESRRHSAAQ